MTVFQEFADWVEAQLTIDMEMLPLDHPCTCSNRRRLATHLVSCPTQLAADIKAKRLIIEDARQEPADFSMRMAAMYLGLTYADRVGYEEGWRPAVLV